MVDNLVNLFIKLKNNLLVHFTVLYFKYKERGDLMSIKEIIDQEKQDLKSVKRPYETAAFIVFAVLFVEQIGYWLLRLFDFIKNGGWFSTNLPRTPLFVTRIIQIDASKWIWVLAGLAGLVLWYFLIYLLVWNYCKKNGYAKWVWTTLIVFGPGTIFLVPTYLIYVLYVFRPYVFRFVKKGVEEYKAFNPNHQFKEEEPEPKPAPKESKPTMEETKEETQKTNKNQNMEQTEDLKEEPKQE